MLRILSSFFIFTFIICANLIIPTPANAAIGISPGTVALDIAAGKKDKFIVNFSRSEEEIDSIVNLEISVEAPYIQLIGPNKVTLNPNNKNHKFEFTVDASDLKIGNYESKIYFKPKIEGKEIKDSTGVAMVLQLGGKVKINVVKEIIKPLDASENLILNQEITITSQVDRKPIYWVGDNSVFKVSWRYNNSAKELTKAASNFKVFLNGRTISTSHGFLKTLKPGEKTEIEQNYTFSRPGKYIFEWSNGYATSTQIVRAWPTPQYFFNAIWKNVKAVLPNR